MLLSATNSLPVASKAKPMGTLSSAAVAAPPSPANPHAPPIPATVLIAPVAAATSRITQLPVSAMKRLPAPSSTTSIGKLSSAAVAAPPSPANPHAPPIPATVLIAPVAATTLRITQLPVSAMKRLPAPSRATPVMLLSSAAVAGPPSPAKPDIPGVPATVLIWCVIASTLRMTKLSWSAMKRFPATSRATPAGR